MGSTLFYKKLLWFVPELKRYLQRGSLLSVALYIVRNAQVAASLLQACYLAVIKPISGCVRIACSDLMTTSLLQVVKKLAAKLQNCKVSLRNVVKCERYRPAKFTNFVYFCITKRKIDTIFSKVVSIFRA